ncbi:MAG: hypothetical protein D6735_12140 [Acidobacteria bacterium]|nr:MAG: hypothetical protein D6735_12140 [Acidobacteriota bacterium]
MAVLCCLMLTSLAAAQKKMPSNRTKKMTSNDVRIVKSKPHVFIGYEREGKIEPLYEGESDTRVWLRFYNNSKWMVMFCSSSVPKEYGETEITYEIERYKGFGETPGTSRLDACGYLLLKAGESIVFSVPREHLAEGLAIKVNFLYEWEVDSDGSISDLEPKHYVYFYSWQIPKNNSGQSKQKRRAKQKRRE